MISCTNCPKIEPLTNNNCFVSLDVVQVYPSIPIDYGVHDILEWAELHLTDSDNFGANIDDLKGAFNFVSYEIEHNGQVSLWKKDCPMDADFAPPFALLYYIRLKSNLWSFWMKNTV